MKSVKNKRHNPHKGYIKTFPLRKLKIGQQVLLGPFLRASTVSTIISRAKDNIFGYTDFTQQQMILVDPVKCECKKVYLVTRTA